MLMGVVLVKDMVYWHRLSGIVVVEQRRRTLVICYRGEVKRSKLKSETQNPQYKPHVRLQVEL